MECAYNLIIAILTQAKSDYITALRKNNQEQIEELEEFFLSDYGQAMSLGNGVKMIKQCRKFAKSKKRFKRLDITEV